MWIFSERRLLRLIFSFNRVFSVLYDAFSHLSRHDPNSLGVMKYLSITGAGVELPAGVSRLGDTGGNRRFLLGRKEET